MSQGRVSFIKKEINGVVFVSGTYQAKVGDGDSLHSFAFRKSDKYGGGMHSWAVAGSDAGGSITKILEDVYNTGKINPCITASKITVDKVKYTVSFYFEIQDSPDGKAYTGFSSWGGAGGSTSAPSGHAYTNYKKEYDAVVKKNPTVTIAIINDFWYPAFFRQVFFQYTRKKFPNLQKGANSKKGTVGVSINQNSPPKNNEVKVLAYNPTGVQPVTSPGLSTVVFTETVAETQSEAPSNEAVVEVNAPAAAPPAEPLVPRVPDFAPDKIFTFNVEKSQKNSPISGFWFSPEAGTFSIVPFIPEFQFTGDEDEQLLDDEYIEVETSITEEELLTQEQISSNQEDSDSKLVVPGTPTLAVGETPADVPAGTPADIKPFTSLATLLDLAGRCARELGKNARVNAANLKKGYIKGVHGLCPQGTLSVLYALTGEKKVGQISGNANAFSFSRNGTTSLSSSGLYNEKIRVTREGYFNQPNQWQVGDVIAMDYTSKPYGHIQVWTGFKWVSDFTQNKLQVSGVDFDSVALHRLNDKGIEAVKKQTG